MTATDRRLGLTGGVALKAPCRVATTANITLSGVQSIDGVTVAAGDRVLVKNQSDATQNGIWDVDSGPWTRAVDFNGRRDAVQGTMVLVIEGTSNQSTVWQLTTSNPSIGSGSLAFSATSAQALGIASAWVIANFLPAASAAAVRTLLSAITAADNIAFTGNNTFAGTSGFSDVATFSDTLAMSGAAINEAVRVDVASATPNIGAAASNYVRITGTTGITAFDTVASGIKRSVVFEDALTITHNGTSLILKGGANITTVAGDTAEFVSEGSGNWRCLDYRRASVVPFTPSILTNSLGANVSMGATGTYYTGPTVAQGTAGTWFVSGTVTVQNTVGGDIVNVKLWDGTTVIASTRLHVVSVSGTYYGVAHLSGRIVAPTGDLRISVSPVNRTDGAIAYNASGNEKDSTLTAYRIA